MYEVEDPGYEVEDPGYEVEDPGYEVEDPGYEAEDLGYEVACTTEKDWGGGVRQPLRSYALGFIASFNKRILNDTLNV